MRHTVISTVTTQDKHTHTDHETSFAYIETHTKRFHQEKDIRHICVTFIFLVERIEARELSVCEIRQKYSNVLRIRKKDFDFNIITKKEQLISEKTKRQ